MVLSNTSVLLYGVKEFVLGAGNIIFGMMMASALLRREWVILRTRPLTPQCPRQGWFEILTLHVAVTPPSVQVSALFSYEAPPDCSRSALDVSSSEVRSH